LVQQQGHLLHLDISRPTKGLRVQLAYGGCDIRHVNIVDHVAGSRQPGLTRLPVVVEYSAAELDLGLWRRHDRLACLLR
jgi:hypothetical protein